MSQQCNFTISSNQYVEQVCNQQSCNQEPCNRQSTTKTLPRNIRGLPFHVVEEVIKLHNPIPGIRTYDLLNSKGWLLCHRTGCQCTYISYAYGGFFCSKHCAELKILRCKIYEVPYNTANRTELEVIKENRLLEVRFRKIMEQGHMEFITAIDKRIKLMDDHGQNFDHTGRHK